MSILAKVAYLSALLLQSEQREQAYQRNLSTAELPHDVAAARCRLASEQARQQDLLTERRQYGG